MTKRRSKICVVATTPLSVHFFFKPHLIGLTEMADVVLIVNLKNDGYVPPLNLPVRIINVGIMRPIAPIKDLLAFIELFLIFRRERFDLVWSTAPKAGLLGMVAARLARVPVRVFIFQGEIWASRKGLGRWILKLADTVIAHCATHLLGVSDSERQFLENERVVSAGKVRVLGAGSISGVDLERYRPDAGLKVSVRLALGIPFDAVVVLFVGRLVADKGILELAEAFEIASRVRPNLWLLMVGPDEDDAAKRVIEILGDAQCRTKIIGFSNQPENYMAASDFICLPSHREGFGMVIIEAGAAGIPAIGSRIYGVSDAIMDGVTGELFDKGSVGKLSEVIARFSDDSALRTRLGSAARMHVIKNFSSDDVVRRYLEYFDKRLMGNMQ